MKADAHAQLDLLAFLPFRLNRLAAESSRSLAAIYGDTFGLDIPEWRVIATLGAKNEPRSAGFIVRSTRTHKSRISRAVADLARRGLIARIAAGADKREVGLALTEPGRAVYQRLIPLMIEGESDLLRGFDPKERVALFDLLARIETNLGVADEA